MRTTIDIATLAANDVNEDRADAAGTLAWVIDGATDVIDAPLTQAATDASWLAETLDLALKDIAAAPPADLSALPAALAEHARAEFELAALRTPSGRHEHPSASGVIVRITGRRLDFVSVGDCSLMLTTPQGILRVGIEGDEAGDPWVAEFIKAFRAKRPDATPDATRQHLWPKLAAGRAAMNTDSGYGVYSITPTPAHFVRSGTLELSPGGHVLLASDGLMRLVDVFRAYTAQTLFAAIVSRGVAALLHEVRVMENEDADCISFPRAKRHDDASGILVRLEG